MISPKDAIDSFPLVGNISSIYKEIEKFHLVEKLFFTYMIWNVIYHVASSDEIHHDDTFRDIPITYNSILVGWFLSVASLCRRIMQYHLHSNDEMENFSSCKSCCTLDTMFSDASYSEMSTSRYMDKNCVDENKLCEYYLVQIIPDENSDWGYFADWEEGHVDAKQSMALHCRINR
mmetsp:Transcript_4814/g.9182  ORF Transcript_4814/g.9182 Transcript_4814/m.9182 type:complete len:176 (-) Transcript_4814:48-575(-)